jgi:diguanylate cyclase (GGDEF)-like protein
MPTSDGRTDLRLVSAPIPRADDGRDLVAFHDPLTGLPNRALFEDRLSYAIAAAERTRGRLAVIAVDLDEFGALNAAKGRSTGDELLKRVGSRLRQAVRKGDTVARLGGDDFGIILPNVPHVEAARLVARKIVDSLGQPFHFDGSDLVTSCSTGVAVFPDDASSLNRLVRCASQAVMHARAVRDHEGQCGESAPAEAEGICSYSTLRRAIEQQRLSLVYQPQVDLATGRICGVEALVRWPEHEGPAVPANEIIAVAESSGLIVLLAEWVLTSACRQMRAWHDEGVFVVRMAVNVSGAQLRQHKLTSIVERTLAETGLPPVSLELELAESLAVEQEGLVLDTMQSLKALGVRLALDDFGMGLSRLGSLARLPLDSLKLDRTFVAPIGQDARASALAGAAIGLAHGLGLKVIAEGVETSDQLRCLRSHRCDVMQGFYFSRPTRPDDVTRLARREPFAVEALSGG